MKPIKKWHCFAWQNRVPSLSDAFFLAGTMLFATLLVYEIFDLDLWVNAGSFLLVGLSFFLYAILMLVAREWRGVLHLCFFVWTALLGFDVWLRTFLKITYGVPAESPMVYWQNKGFSVKYKTLVESRAFQTDMFFSALLNSVLQIKTQIAFPQNDIFDAQNFRSRERFYEYTDID